jgi:DNA-binding NtrC family response regulator
MGAARAKILIIEDEKELLNLVSHRLKQQGYNVESASDGNLGLNLAVKNDYDLILSDIKLPGQRGTELIKKVRESKTSARVIFMTGYGTMDDAITAMKSDVSDFIHKPFKFPVLMGGIEKALKKKEEIDEDLDNVINLEESNSRLQRLLTRSMQFQQKERKKLFLIFSALIIVIMAVGFMVSLIVD